MQKATDAPVTLNWLLSTSPPACMSVIEIKSSLCTYSRIKVSPYKIIEIDAVV